MNLQVKLAFEGNLEGFSKAVDVAVLAAERRAAERMAVVGKLALRADVRAGGLGDRVANAWQARVYPTGSKLARNPAVYLYSKAPQIVSAFTEGATITPHDGHAYLALPTENTPRTGRHYATPEEVEIIFNQDLIFFPGRGQQVLAFVDAVKARSGKGYRRASKGRAGRAHELVLMFVMVRQVRLQKRLHWPEIRDELAPQWRELLGDEVAAALEAVDA